MVLVYRISMVQDRPYAANYAIGLLVVMGFHMAFNSLSVLLYPELFRSEMYRETFFLYLFIGVSIWEFILAAMLFMGSGLSHKLAVASMVLVLILIVGNIVIGGVIGFDIWFQVALGASVLIFLLLPNVRGFYDNWSLGKLPDTEL